MVLQQERADPLANITTAGDAIWWAYVTITTVGYGDQFPVTTGGRLVGIMVMTTGVAVFATFAGLISSKLLAPPAKEEEKPEVPAEGDEVARYRAELKQLIGEREKIEGEIATRIDKLDKTPGRTLFRINIPRGAGEVYFSIIVVRGRLS